MSDTLLLGGAIATDLLIGRNNELATIRRAAARSDKAFRCVLIAASGGLGKTRLLAEVSARLGAPMAIGANGGSPPPPWPEVDVVAVPLIDVADPYLHTTVPFLRAVREGLRSNPIVRGERIFQRFDNALEQYDLARDGEQPFDEVSKRREQVVARFLESYQRLTRHKRVVWLIDTMEQLITTRPELEALGREAGISEVAQPDSTYRWLLEFVSQPPANTTMLLAGRLNPGRWVEDIDTAVQTCVGMHVPSLPMATPLPQPEAAAPEDFRATMQISEAGVLERTEDDDEPSVVLTLKRFSYEEIESYLRALHALLQARATPQNEYATVADDLGRYMLKAPEQLEAMALLTDGNPIRLAVYVDLLLNSSSTPLPFYTSLDRLRALTPEKRQELSCKVDRTLLGYLEQNMGRDENQVIRLLALARRGLDLERLAPIWSDDRDLGQKVLRRLCDLSFVKYRPARNVAPALFDPDSGKLFLHDEFYTIYQEGIIRESEDDLKVRREDHRRIFDQLIEYCRSKFEQRVQELIHEQPQITALAEKVDSDHKHPQYKEYLTLKDKARLMRHERRQLRAEELHYQLYKDPIWAFFDLYTRRVEEAFSANAFEHEAQYRSEIDLYFFGARPENVRVMAGLSETEWDLLRLGVIYEQVSSWIRRLTSHGDFDSAIRLADTAQRFPELAQDHHSWLAEVRATPAGGTLEHLYGHEWAAYGAFAAIFRGTGITTTIARLQVAADQLDLLLNTEGEALPTPCHTHFRIVRAQAYLYIGYAFANLNQFEKARSYYEQADRLLEMTAYRTLQAEIRNDLSRVLGELGNAERALRYCHEGLIIRRAHGFDYLQALSYNTMALIYLRNDNLIKGKLWADEALKLFRQLNQARGIGLALLQKVEALRRRANTLISERRLLTDQPAILSAAEGAEIEAELREAEHCLDEAEDIFRRRIKEKVRQIEAGIARAGLYRDWATIRGDAGSYYQSALKALDDVIAFTMETPQAQSDFQLYQLNARIVKAMIHQRRSKRREAERELALALALIPDSHRLTPEHPLLLEGQEVYEVYFRELSRIAYVRAGLVLASAPNRDEQLIEQYVLATTYMQLFSPYETTYGAQNRRLLAIQLSRIKAANRLTDREIADRVRKVRDHYQIGYLRSYLDQRKDAFAIAPVDRPVIDEFIDP